MVLSPVPWGHHVETRIPLPLAERVFRHGILVVGLCGPVKITDTPVVSHEGVYATIGDTNEEWRILQLLQQRLGIAVRRDAAITGDDSVTTYALRFRNRRFPYT